MSHVSEGELHMILDGAVDLLPADRAKTVERHVAGCRECTRRLEEERAVRDHAIELMDSTAPSGVVVPSFEEVEAIARSDSDSAGAVNVVDDAPATRATGARGIWRGLTPGMGLAWAATVILSLGIGYFGAESLGVAVPQGGVAPTEFERAPSASAPTSTTRDDAVASLSKVEGGRARASVARPVPAEQPLARNQQVESIAGAGARSESGLAGARADAPGEEVLASTRPDARAEEVLPAAGADAPGDEALADAAADALVLDAPATPTVAVSQTKAELRLLSMAQTTTPSGAPSLELRHLLPSGDTIEIRWVRIEDAAETEEDFAQPEVTDEPTPDYLRLRGLTSSDTPAVLGEAPRAARAAPEQVEIDRRNREEADRRPASADEARAAAEAGAPPPAVAQPTEAPSREDTATPSLMVEPGRRMQEQLEAGRNRATITVGGWRVEAVGPISRDSLLTILRALGAPGEP